jgi:uncharacterized protein with FMN-binding domain
MKKFFLSFGLIIVFAFYVLINSSRNAVSQPTLSSNTPTSADVVTPTIAKITSKTITASAIPKTTAVKTTALIPTPVPKPIATPTPAPAPTPVATTNTGKYKNGTYSGPVVDAYYGNVQVSAVVQNGALADVQFLQYPSDRSTSVRINSQAMPRLKSEAIQAQSASVNGVSGATATSGAFKQSLSAALATALN